MATNHFLKQMRQSASALDRSRGSLQFVSLALHCRSLVILAVDFLDTLQPVGRSSGEADLQGSARSTAPLVRSMSLASTTWTWRATKSIQSGWSSVHVWHDRTYSRSGCTSGMRSDCRAVITSREVMLASYSCAAWHTMELISCLVISRHVSSPLNCSPIGVFCSEAFSKLSAMRICNLSAMISCLNRLKFR